MAFIPSPAHGMAKRHHVARAGFQPGGLDPLRDVVDQAGRVQPAAGLVGDEQRVVPARLRGGAGEFIARVLPLDPDAGEGHGQTVAGPLMEPDAQRVAVMQQPYVQPVGHRSTPNFAITSARVRRS